MQADGGIYLAAGRSEGMGKTGLGRVANTPEKKAESKGSERATRMRCGLGQVPSVSHCLEKAMKKHLAQRATMMKR